MPFSEDPAFGSFSDTPKIEFINTPGAPNRRVRLLEAFSYTDPEGVVWDAPKDSLVDGASIPRALWTAVGSPFDGDYFYASIVHDTACDRRDRPWRDVHYMFYRACRAGGTSPGKAKIMYLAVRNFGPRWPQPGAKLAHESFGLRTQALMVPVGDAIEPVSQQEYIQRAQHYLATHGDDAPLEAIDVYASGGQ